MKFYQVLLCAAFILGVNVVATANRNNWIRETRGSCPGMCKEPKASQSCGMTMSKFWYNAKTKSCEPFVYEGCGGNENRFGSKGLCEKMCKAKC